MERENNVICALRHKNQHNILDESDNNSTSYCKNYRSIPLNLQQRQILEGIPLNFQQRQLLKSVPHIEKNPYRIMATKSGYLWVIIRGSIWYNNLTKSYERKKEIVCVCAQYQDAQKLCRLRNTCSIQNTYWIDSIMEKDVRMEDFIGKPIIKNLREGVNMQYKYLYAVVSKSKSSDGKDHIDFFYTNYNWAETCIKFLYDKSDEAFVMRIITMDIPNKYFWKVPINKF